MTDHVVPRCASLFAEEPVTFTLPALCRASGAEQALVVALVGEGRLQPTGLGPSDWRFTGDALPQTRRAHRLALDLELDLAAMSLVLDLLAEIDRLRTSQRQH